MLCFLLGELKSWVANGYLKQQDNAALCAYRCIKSHPQLTHRDTSTAPKHIHALKEKYLFWLNCWESHSGNKASACFTTYVYTTDTCDTSSTDIRHTIRGPTPPKHPYVEETKRSMWSTAFHVTTPAIAREMASGQQPNDGPSVIAPCDEALWSMVEQILVNRGNWHSGGSHSAVCLATHIQIHKGNNIRNDIPRCRKGSLQTTSRWTRFPRPGFKVQNVQPKSIIFEGPVIKAARKSTDACAKRFFLPISTCRGPMKTTLCQSSLRVSTRIVSPSYLSYARCVQVVVVLLVNDR